MDEPTSALDPISTSKIEDLAVELKRITPLSWSHITCSRRPVSPTRQHFSFLVRLWNLRIQTSCSPCRRISVQRIILQEGLVDIMSERFVRQLEELHVELITMGSLCEKAISLSAKAIQGEGGMTLIGKIFETEKEIDAQEKRLKISA